MTMTTRLAELLEVVDELIQLDLPVLVLVDISKECLALVLNLLLVHRFPGVLVVREQHSLYLAAGDRPAVVSINLVERLRQGLHHLLRIAARHPVMSLLCLDRN